MIGLLLIKFACAMVVGFAIGLSGFWLNKIDNEVYRIKGKALWAATWAIAIVVISEFLQIPDAKYMSSLFFGYGSFRVWG